MAKEIGRLNSFWLGIETTKGTEIAASVYIPLTAGKIIPEVVKTNVEEGRWVIDQVSDSYVTQKMTRLTGTWSVKSNSFGYIGLLAFGTAWAPVEVEIGVYTHAFTRKNDNNHPSATVYGINTTQQEKSTYHMIDTLDFTFAIGEKAEFSVATVGQKLENSSWNTAAFTSGDEDFIVNCAEVKIADDVAGIAWATPVSLQNMSLSIQKNLMQIFGTRTASDCQYEFESQHNQQFAVSGDFEITFDSKAYQEIYEDGDVKAVQIEFVGRTLVGATEFNKVTFLLPKVSFESFDKTDSNDTIVSQTIGFISMYDATNGTISMTLQNNKSTQYA